MIDRGIIKWQPFDSCYSSEKIVKEIQKDKEKISFPTLSPDQLEVIEEAIRSAYEVQTQVQIKYFYNGVIYQTTGKIKGINLQEKKIYLNNKSIFLKQILKIN